MSTLRGLVDERVRVVMEGGELEIEVAEDLDLIMTGPVEEVATGMLSPDLKTRLVEVQVSSAAPPEPKR